MGPEAAQSFPGPQVGRALPAADGTRPVERATQDLDYGRRGKGYLFGAFVPATGEAVTTPSGGRTIVNGVDCLEQVEAWLPAEAERVYAVLDNLSVHRTTDVLLFALAHPRWACVFTPTYAADLNLSEPWGKVLRSPALTGRRFATWEQVCRAVAAAAASGNAHRHALVWGRRRRHQPRRRAGIGLTPKVA